MNTPKARPTLIIPSETQAREFDAKLLLACAAAERGFTSVIGSRYDIHLKISSLPRGLYVGKDVRGSSLKMFRIMEDLGYKMVAWDEEALLPYPPDRYYKTRVSAEALHRVVATFAWGEENADLFRGFPEWGDIPIYVTGNSRFDLLRPELRKFFHAERDKLLHRHGNFILVNTNFGMLNHYVPNLISLLPEDAGSARKVDDFTAELSEHRYGVFTHFLQMIPVLSKKFADFTIVIRPHPSENHDVWLKIAEQHSNVRVIYEGSVLPWILACKAMIHNGCTTAIESYVLDKPAVAYRPVTSEQFEKELPNGVSVEAFTLDELLDSLGHAIQLGTPLKTPEREGLIRRHLEGIDGALATDRILDAIEKLNEQVDSSWPGIKRYMRGRCRASIRTLGKLRNAKIAGHKNNSEYQIHRFPGIQLAEVQERVLHFGELLGRFHSVKASQISKNIFQISGK